MTQLTKFGEQVAADIANHPRIAGTPLALVEAIVDQTFSALAEQSFASGDLQHLLEEGWAYERCEGCQDWIKVSPDGDAPGEYSTDGEGVYLCSKCTKQETAQ